MSLEPATLINARYRVVRQVGRGGMGAVYEAVDERLRAPVALKQLAAVSAGAGAAFEREAQILAGLRHPSLPRVIDYFADPAGQFLVMEFIPGDDMAARLAARGAPFPPAELLAWADQLLDALDYLHTRTPPVIHRDIKPQNLKIGPRGEPILLDFGLAKGSAAIAGASALPSLFGYTPQYAPLEQIQGSGTGPPADLFSLASTLYHLLTGQPPADALAPANAALNGQPDPLHPAHELRPELPPALGGLLAQALALRVDGRFASAAAMRAALRTIDPEPAFGSAPTIAESGPQQGWVAQPAWRAATPPAVPGPDPRLAEGGRRESASPSGPAADPPAPPVPRRGWLTRAPAEPRRFSGRVPLLIGLVALLLIRLADGLGINLGGPAPTPAAGQAAAGAPTADPREQAPAAPALPAAELVELDARIAGTIRGPGQLDAYRFGAPAGARIFVWTFAYDQGMEQLDVALLGPDGRELAGQCLGCGNIGRLELRAAGEHRIVVGDAADPATGAYELRVSLVPPPAEYEVGDDARIAGDAPAPGAATIRAPGAANVYRFAAAPGEFVFVSTLRYDPGMEQVGVALLGPDDRTVASGCLGCGNLGAQPLTLGGGYRLVVGDEDDPATGAYELRLSKVPPPHSFAVALPFAVAPGQPGPGAGMIELPGASDSFGFSAVAGQQIVVRTLRYDGGMEQIDVALLGPDGQELKRGCLGCGDLGQITLSLAGEHRIIVGDTREGAVGTFEIEVASP